jgi:hypothetical protein
MSAMKFAWLHLVPNKVDRRRLLAQEVGKGVQDFSGAGKSTFRALGNYTQSAPRGCAFCGP